MEFNEKMQELRKQKGLTQEKGKARLAGVGLSEWGGRTHERFRYRCFLPDLAGFTAPRCPTINAMRGAQSPRRLKNGAPV